MVYFVGYHIGTFNFLRYILLCEYGCEQKANFITSSNKRCCSKTFRECPGYRKKLAKGNDTAKGCFKKGYHKITKLCCLKCKKEISKTQIKKHLNACFNRIQKECPICKTIIKDLMPYQAKHITFCSRECSDESKRNGSNYRFICFSYFEKKCLICEESNVIDVHHLDGNRDNNLPSNLIPLCPTHHMYLHRGHKNLIMNQIEQTLEKLNVPI